MTRILNLDRVEQTVRLVAGVAERVAVQVLLPGVGVGGAVVGRVAHRVEVGIRAGGDADPGSAGLGDVAQVAVVADRAVRFEHVSRAVVADAVAVLGDVADAGAGRQTRRALGVGRAVVVHAVAGLGDVADAGRAAADAPCSWRRPGSRRRRRRSSRRRRRRRRTAGRRRRPARTRRRGRRRWSRCSSRRCRRRRPRRGRRCWRARRRRPGSRRPRRRRSRRRRRRRPRRGRPAVLLASAGQAAPEPVQFSATSQTPAEPRQTVVLGCEGVGRAGGAGRRCRSRRRRRRPPSRGRR